MEREQDMDLLRRLIDQAAEQVVMMELTDPAAPAALARQLREIAVRLRSMTDPDWEKVQQAARLMDQVAAGEAERPASAVEAVSQTIAALQTAKCFGLTAPEAAGPSTVQGAGGAEPSDSSELQNPILLSDPGLVKEFVTEALEHLEAADANLVTLEETPDNAEAISAVFRAFHTIKGGAGFLDLAALRTLAHATEDLLDEVRNGRRPFQDRTVELTFSALDMVKHMVENISSAAEKNAPVVPPAQLPVLLRKIRCLLDQGNDPGVPDPEASREVDPEPAETPLPVGPARTGNPPRVAAPETASVAGSAMAPVPKGGASGRQQIRMDAGKVDLLLDMIGELVIAESIVAQDPAITELKSLRLERNLAHLGKITRGLQDLGLAMRMVPLESTFRKMTRLVRDLAKKSGKEIEFTMEGQETEIDKGIVEKLSDPLLHMFRNAVDHGIEATADLRRAAGKSATGHIALRACHQGGNIHIEIEDDGRGLDRPAIVAKALERGMIGTGAGLSDQDVFALIFESGFSTADKITDVSGRGVGMDVVRRTVESLRGHISIRSTIGKGTTFTIVLPLTTAIIDGMLVRVGKELYIIPTLAIVESVHSPKETICTILNRGEMLDFRGRLVPIFHLASVFGVPSSGSGASDDVVVIVEDSGVQAGIVIDELVGQQQTVIKSLGAALGSVKGISGASILADGKPGLIVDVTGLVKMATSHAGRRMPPPASAAPTSEVAAKRG